MASYSTQKVRQLCKLFIGCRGAITRIHTDNHRAHAWLTNLHGYKLYILCAPEEGERVLPPGENGKGFLPRLDPLDMEQRALPQHSGVKLHATILRPGETIVVPEGWWHYAASLTQTVTLMCNFWDAANVRAVEDLFLENVARTLDDKRRQDAADFVDGRGPIPSAAAATSSKVRTLAEQRAFRVVHKPFVYIREAPCTDAGMLGIARPGTIIHADAERDGWLRLKRVFQHGRVAIFHGERHSAKRGALFLLWIQLLRFDLWT